MRIEVCSCCIDDVVRADLKATLGNLQEDRKKRKTKRGTAIFDADATRDIAMLDEHIAALKLVLRYYGET